jgi:hypothetical protein
MSEQTDEGPGSSLPHDASSCPSENAPPHAHEFGTSAMIWALLAILGVPLWLVVGALGAALLNRRSVKAVPGTMRGRIRVTSGSVPGFNPRWPRSSCYAFWVRDVLVVRAGFAMVRTRLLPASSADEIERRHLPELKRLGPEQVVLGLELDSGSTIELAVSAAERSELPGPFLLAEGGSEQPRALPRTDAS